MNIPASLKNKGKASFFFLLSSSLSLVTMIVYIVAYAGNDEFSVLIPILLSIGFISIFSEILKDIWEYFRVIPLISSWATTLTFIYKTYYYISVVFVGIDADSFSFQFIISLILLLLTSGISVASIFIPLKEEK